MCCLVVLTFIRNHLSSFQAMPWPSDFVDKLIYRLNAFGAPKVSCQQMIPNFNSKPDQITWLDVIESIPGPTSETVNVQVHVHGGIVPRLDVSWNNVIS